MTIEWGDCDDAGIVFYPNYFRWFDNAFHHLLRSCGIGQRTLVERFDTIGTPIADAGARFLRPATYGDDIVIHTRVEEWHRKMFRVAHRVLRDDDLIAEGHELRFWGQIDKATGKLRAAEIDAEFKRAITVVDSDG